MVPYDVNFSKAVMRQKPVSIMFPSSIAAKSFESIVDIMESSKKTANNAGIKKFFKSVFSKKMKE